MSPLPAPPPPDPPGCAPLSLLPPLPPPVDVILEKIVFEPFADQAPPAPIVIG
jgi:hypothetical protein